MGGADGTGFLWLYVFPLLSCSLLGSTRGIRATAILLGATTVLIFVRSMILDIPDFSGAFVARLIGSLLVVSLFSYITELTRERSQRRATPRGVVGRRDPGLESSVLSALSIGLDD